MEDPFINFLIVAAALLGSLLTFRKNRRDWRKKTEEWHEKLYAECGTDPVNEPGWLIAEKRFYRRQYRIRMQIGICLLLQAVLIAGVWYCLVNRLAEEGMYCVVAVVLLILWKSLLALFDCVQSYIYLSRKDANEIIAEEKEFLRNEYQKRHMKKK